MTDQELENLVRLTGLVDQIEADLATLLGASLELADMARGDDGGDTMVRWRQRRQQAMDAGRGCLRSANGQGPHGQMLYQAHRMSGARFGN